MNTRIPSLRKHATGQFCVVWNRKTHYLGADEKKARERYQEELTKHADWVAEKKANPAQKRSTMKLRDGRDDNRDWVEFRSTRPEHFNFVLDKIMPCKRHAIISAGVKSGKKELILIQSRANEHAPKKHVLISNFKRNDCKEQISQLNSYNVETFYAGELSKAVPYIKDLIRRQIKVTVHVDESDYGTGKKQKMSPTFDAIRSIKDDVCLRLYSATNEEAIYSEFASECDLLTMPDPPSFFGPDDFLDNDLVREAEPFWDDINNKLSTQAEEACEYWGAQNKPFAVLRIASGPRSKNKLLTYASLKKNQVFLGQLARRGITTVFVDANSPFYWGKAGHEPVDMRNWSSLDKNRKWLIVINQTCVRSTEIGFHPLIAFWHDYRSKDSEYNTIHQAQLRVVHYPYLPTEFWPNPSVNIRVYGCVRTFELAAANEYKRRGKPYITPEDYQLESGRLFRGLSSRIRPSTEKKNWRPEFFEPHQEQEARDFACEVFQKDTVRQSCVSTQGHGRGQQLVEDAHDICGDILKGARRQTYARIVLLDKPNPDFLPSWNEFMAKYPNKEGWFMVEVEEAPTRNSPETMPISMFAVGK